ncbi:A/G-specific adenine glycosylase [Corynebacterium amycolatum]|uniref:A/G-specific adenine glycosylase n=1 Tax=Corynebacterium amycolatum TaxID=43765 RepID=UPI000848216A|nr:A/G-specific adenine glycosylase [Corynebacterium amycolatum]ODQ43445.1 adenine glycosylase [Corynebacterium amycolatum]
MGKRECRLTSAISQSDDFDEHVDAALRDWYRANMRPLPWREEGTSPWAVLVSEVMSQQTPVARVIPSWHAWLEKWPTPADLAVAPKDEVLRMWGKLGYPRRALRLRECAETIVEKHDGEVPSDVDTLLALPGVGDYTARAVAAFAFGARTPVVDINVRRVLRRHRQGTYLPGTAKRADMALVEELLPLDPTTAAETSVALMELGATVCRTTPECEACPIATSCVWIAAGRPEPEDHEIAAAKRRVQKFEGTDRQVRGLLLDVLRAADSPVEQAALDAVWDDAHQRSRALFSLLDDGLAEQTPDGRFQLPR